MPTNSPGYLFCPTIGNTHKRGNERLAHEPEREGPFGAVEGNAPGAEMATMFTVPLLVMGMQNTVPSMAACGMPSVRLPAHMAVSLMHRVAGLPKAPACVWPEQKTPVVLVVLALPVVRGFRSTLSAPLKSPWPSSGGQSALVFSVAGLPVVALVEQAPLAGAPKKRRAARQRSA